MFCSNCGKECREGEIFCGGCGSKIEPKTPSVVQQPVVNNAVTPEVPPMKKGMPTWLVVLLIIIATIFILGIIFVAFFVIFNDCQRRKSLSQTDAVSKNTAIVLFQFIDDRKDGIFLKIIEFVPD